MSLSGINLRFSPYPEFVICIWGYGIVPVTVSRYSDPAPHRFLLRKRFPKTSVPAPGEGHPTRFTSVASTFTWPDAFIDAAADKYGEKWLAKRLRAWRWNMSTTFSGVGCAESAPRQTCYNLLDVHDKFHRTNHNPAFNSYYCSLHSQSQVRINLINRGSSESAIRCRQVSH